MKTTARKPALALIAASVLLTACGGSFGSGGSYNPLNWFRSADQDETPSAAPQAGAVVDFRQRIAQVTELKIEPAPGGAIIRVTGLPPTQGYFDAGLVALNAELPVDGVLTYEFRAHAPFGFEQVSNQASREVIAGVFVSDQTLLGVRLVRVLGAENSLSSRP